MAALRERVASLVAAATAGGAASAAAPELLKYLQDAKTADLVYLSVLERAASDRSTGAELVNRCVRLLRVHLPEYEPSPDVRAQLHAFCESVIENCPNDAVVKSALFLQNIIARRRSGVPDAGDAAGRRGTADEGASDPEVAAHDSPARPLSQQQQRNGSSAHEAVTAPQRARSQPQRRTNIIANIMTARTRAVAFAPLTATAPWALNYLDLFGGHFDMRAAPSGRFEIVHDDDAIRLGDYAQTMQRIETVSKAKKSEESKVYKESGQMPKAVKAPQLFAYKFYSEQPALDLPTDKLAIVTNAAVTPSTSQHAEERLTASKIMVKVLVDQYCSGNLSVVREILALFLEMLEGPAESKIHAFNLLFNLAIHTNLISENVPRFDPVEAAAVEGGVPSFLTTQPRLVENLEQIESVLLDLYDKLCEMLLFLIHRRVCDSSVWETAFNCFLFFVAANGVIDQDKVRMVDPRVLAAFIRHGNLSDVVRPHVVAMIVNLLYDDEQSPLDMTTLEDIDGIDFIISLYEQSRAAQEAENLFVIIFDCAISHLGGSGVVDSTDADMVLQVLHRLGAAHMFQSWFRYVPPRASEAIVRFISQDAAKRDPSVASTIEALNKSLLVAVLYEMERMAQAHVKLERELEPLVKNVAETGEVGKAVQQAIKSLISSDSGYERRQGIQWMFSLCQTYRVDEPAKMNETIGRAVDTVLNNMVQQKAERLSYLQIVDKIMRYRVHKLGSAWSESDLTITMNFLNDKLSRLVNVQEKDETHLLIMFDIVFSMIFIDFAADSGPQRADLWYNRFLQGGAVVSYKILSKVNISIFHHMFVHLLRDQHRNIRAVLLVLMMEQCRSKRLLESIGGMNFYKTLLGSRDPQLAYHASRFLVDQIKSERPEQFRTLLAGLLAKAQQANDERIIDNPYLQIRSILELKKL